MNIKNLLRTAATLAAALLLVLPAAAQQADFTTFVSIGDSLSGGFLDSCWVEYGQRDSYPAIIARQAGVSAFEQPLIGKPGLGSPGCMYLTSLAPTFGYRPSTGLPLNLTLARPYNNLSIPGFTIHDVVTTNPTAGASLALLTLRGKGTALLQAASLKPTFMTIYVGNNDIFGAITSATTIPCPDPAVQGCTLTSMSSVNADLDTIFNTLKAAQGGTGKGVVLNLGDGPNIPFVTTVSPVLGTNPANGQPIYALSNVGCPTGVPVCPVPPGSYLTLVAAQYLQAGYGIPCAILPPTDPRQANCNKPLPDNYSVNPTTGAVSPGVVLTPPEVAAIRLEIQQINAAIQTKATAAGYKVMDMQAWFSDIVAHGRSYGGLNATTAYLAGGIFSYDGAHLSSLGYAILANDVINFIKANYGNNLVQADMYPYLFNGDTSAGGYPIGAALSPDEQISWAAAIFAPDTWQENLKYIFPHLNLHHAMTPNPLDAPISIGREVSGDAPDRVH
jgi:lysophospholipase L1-like esterase